MNKKGKKHDLDYYLGNRVNVNFEMILCVIKNIDVDIKWYDGYYVFSNYFYNLIRLPIDIKMKSRLYKLRKYYHAFGNKRSWKQSLKDYMNINSQNRRYCLENEGTIVINTQCRFCENREQYYLNFIDDLPIEKPIDIEEKATMLQYGYGEKTKVMRVNQEIKKYPQLFGYCNKKKYKIEENKDWQAILNEMGEKNPERYRNREGIILKNLTNNPLQLDKLVHIVGTLGSGKSTFKEALIYDSIHTEKLRVVAIEENIPKVLDLVINMRKCGIKAVPYIGNLSEDKYCKEYLEKYFTINQIIESEEIEWLSGACIVKANVEDNSLEYPCNKLVNQNKKNVICTFTGECGHLERYRQLPQAELIVATPQAVIKSSVIKAIDSYQRSLYELLFDIADIIIVDEADSIQRIFEENLITTLKLNRGENSILKQFEKLLSSYPNADSADDVIYSFDRSYNDIKSDITLIERILRSNMEIVDIYTTKGVIPILLKDEVLNGFNYESEEDEKIFKESIEKYVELCDINNIRKEHLNNDFKLLIDYIRDIHLIYNINPESEFSKSLDDIISKYKIKYKCENNLEAHKIQKKKLMLLLLIVQLDAKVKMLCNEYSKVYLKLTNEYKQIEGYNRFNHKLLQFITEPPIGNIYGYKLSFDNKKLDIEINRYNGVGRNLLLNWSNTKEELGLEGPALLCLSGTSLAPKSAHYNINKEPDAILIGKPEGKITMECLFVAKKEKYVRISGCSLEKRRKNIGVLIEGIERELLYCLNSTNYRKIIVVCGSYEEAKEIGLQLKNDNFNAFYVYKDSNEENKDKYGITKKDIEKIPKLYPNLDILVAPLKIIARGYNILDYKGNSYFGTMFFIARPYMIPDDYGSYIQILHYKLDDYIEDIVRNNDTFHDRISTFKKRCFKEFIEISNITTWKSLNEEQRNIMTWFILIEMKQAIGRMQRNGNDCFVYLCDSAFCDAYGSEKEYTPINSTVHAIEDLLSSIIQNESTKVLYNNFYEAIRTMNQNLPQNMEE